MVQAVTRYVARRLVERERALADDVAVGPVVADKIARLERSRQRWGLFWTFVIGFVGGAVALFSAGAAQRSRIPNLQLEQLHPSIQLPSPSPRGSCRAKSSRNVQAPGAPSMA